MRVHGISWWLVSLCVLGACSAGRPRVIGASFTLATAAPRAQGDAEGWWTRTTRTVVADHACFYDAGTMLGLGAGLAVAGLAANSQLDRDIYEDVLQEWRTEEWNEFRDNLVPFGDGAYVLPVLATTSLLAPALGGDAVGEWGERSLRTILVGAPPVLALQRLTGAGRPESAANTTSSEWEPFRHSNGVSGHAFIGAVPFLTAAAMQDDPIVDALCYVGSAAVPAARLQGFRHYFSQVVLGWWIAYLATDAVNDATSAGGAPGTAFVPFADGESVGFFVVHRF